MRLLLCLEDVAKRLPGANKHLHLQLNCHTLEQACRISSCVFISVQDINIVSSGGLVFAYCVHELLSSSVSLSFGGLHATLLEHWSHSGQLFRAHSRKQDSHCNRRLLSVSLYFELLELRVRASKLAGQSLLVFDRDGDSE